MKPELKRITELLYVILCLRLFETYSNPQHVFSFIKACCIMYELPQDIIQQATLKVMSTRYNLKIVLFEMARLSYKYNIPAQELMRTCDVPRSSFYRLLKKVHPPTPLIMTDKELEVLAKFIYNFSQMGRMIT